MSHPAKNVTPRTHRVGGLDPGPQPGTCILLISAVESDADGPVVQTVTASVGVELDALLHCDHLAVERYVLQPRSGRSQDKGAQAATLVMAEDTYTRAVAFMGRPRVQYLGAGNVKGWATDARLERYGLKVRGGHHRDAVRHALYYAVRLGLLPRL